MPVRTAFAPPPNYSNVSSWARKREQRNVGLGGTPSTILNQSLGFKIWDLEPSKRKTSVRSPCNPSLPRGVRTNPPPSSSSSFPGCPFRPSP